MGYPWLSKLSWVPGPGKWNEVVTRPRPNGCAWVSRCQRSYSGVFGSNKVPGSTSTSRWPRAGMATPQRGQESPVPTWMLFCVPGNRRGPDPFRRAPGPPPSSQTRTAFVGRSTASTIASTSAASFFCLVASGFTYTLCWNPRRQGARGSSGVGRETRVASKHGGTGKSRRWGAKSPLKSWPSPST